MLDTRRYSSSTCSLICTRRDKLDYTSQLYYKLHETVNLNIQCMNSLMDCLCRNQFYISCICGINSLCNREFLRQIRQDHPLHCRLCLHFLLRDDRLQWQDPRLASTRCCLGTFKVNRSLVGGSRISPLHLHHRQEQIHPLHLSWFFKTILILSQ